MKKTIQYLTQNPEVITMLQEEKICLVGLENKIERDALVDVLNGELEYEKKFWN